MVRTDGTVDYELNHENHALKLNGGASDITKTSYGGNAMSEIPLIWVKRWTQNNYHFVVFCEEQYDDTYKAYGYYNDCNGVKWLYVVYKNIVGYASSKYLSK